MSYILDALKKSEQEREQGNIPHLQSIHASSVSVEKKSYKWLYIGVVSALLMAVAVIVWINYFSSQMDVVTDMPTDIATTDATAVITDGTANNKISSVTKAISQTSQKPAIKDKPKPKPVKSASGSSTSNAKKKPVDKPKEKESSNVVFLKEEIADEDLYSEEPLDISSIDKASDEPAKQTQTGKSKSKPKPKKAKKPSVANIADLPNNIRNAIPDIKFTGHVYISTAERRSVIINGKKLREGDYVNADVKLEEITENGAVFSYQGSRFRLGAMKDWSSR